MKFADKKFEFYWAVIKWPTILLTIWYVFGYVMSLFSFSTYMDVFSNSWVGFGLPLVFFALSGYLMFTIKKAGGKYGAWAGTLTGILISTVGLVLMILFITTTPLIEYTVDMSMDAVAETGQSVDEDMIRSWTEISMYIGPIFSFVINGLLGALFGWIGSLIAKGVEK